jgi:murein L,D-transpeptidase YcbB/YkuD
MKKQLMHFAVATAAAFSMTAYAGGDKHEAQQSQSQSIPQSESAQSQTQAQNPELVKQAQEKLSAAGHDAGQPDGVMGPQTQTALKEFQQSKGLEASGKLDQETVAALGVEEGASTGSTAERTN